MTSAKLFSKVLQREPETKRVALDIERTYFYGVYFYAFYAGCSDGQR